MNKMNSLVHLFDSGKEEYKMTPLHIATHYNDTKLKSLILNYMTKITYKNETTFLDIFPTFLTQPGFLEYFDSL